MKRRDFLITVPALTLAAQQCLAAAKTTVSIEADRFFINDRPRPNRFCATTNFLQFRTEMLNFPNHPNFALPNQGRGNSAFGRVSGLIGGNAARIIQSGLHYRQFGLHYRF